MKNRNLVGRLSGQQKAAEAAFDTTISLLTSIKNGQYQEAVRLYEQLPEASPANKSVMLGMITAQSQLDEAKYLAAIDRYREAFPNDPSLGLVLLDAALLRQDWDLLELSRQKLNAWTGGDPYVDLLIGTIFSQDPARVQQALDMTKGIDPSTLGLPTAHYNKLPIAPSGKDFPTVVQQMKVLRDEYEVEFEEESMRSEPLFADFLDSQEFRDWQSR
jgi:tetratricopeptide (TPR) repeat protein